MVFKQKGEIQQLIAEKSDLTHKIYINIFAFKYNKINKTKSQQPGGALT